MIGSNPWFPPPRLDLTDAAFSQRLLWSSIRLLRLGWPVIQVNVGCGKPSVMNSEVKVMMFVGAVNGRSC